MTQSAVPDTAVAVRTPPVVLLTGWGSTGRVFDGLISALGGDFALRTAAMDLAEAPQDAGSEAVLEWALDALARELPPGSVLVGWSLGGALALRFAARFPGRLAAVVSIASNPCFCARADWPGGMPAPDFAAFRAAYQADADAQLGRFAALQATGDAAAGAVRRALRDARPDAAHSIRLGPALDLLAALDVRADLAAIEVPVLHMLGEKDPLVPVSLAARLSALQPAASVWVAAGSAHAPFLSRPLAVAARLRDFIVSLRPPQRRPAAGVARSFGRAAQRYDAAAALQRDCAGALLALAPQLGVARLMDLGCGTGAMLPALRERFAGAQLLAVDIAPPMLQAARGRLPDAGFVAADAGQLPFADASVDLVFSSLALQWCASPGSAFASIARVLRPGGMALIAVPGPATLWELRAAWQAVDGRDHVNRFLPLTALLAAAGAAGLHAESIEREDRIERHPDARSVVRGLRAIGANTLDAERSAGLGGRAAWARLDACYAEFADAGEGMPATWELLRLVLRRPYV